MLADVICFLKMSFMALDGVMSFLRLKNVIHVNECSVVSSNGRSSLVQWRKVGRN